MPEAIEPAVIVRPIATATEIYEAGSTTCSRSDNPAAFYAVDEARLTGGACRSTAGSATHPRKRSCCSTELPGPVLDIGCGAGRHLAALSPPAESRRPGSSCRGGRSRSPGGEGANVVHGSVFDLPEAGNWMTALLIDGNIGIGGEPERLLARVPRSCSGHGARLWSNWSHRGRDPGPQSPPQGPGRGQRVVPVGLGRSRWRSAFAEQAGSAVDELRTGARWIRPTGEDRWSAQRHSRLSSGRTGG